ncbi:MULTISPECIES: FtsK/SpoIIIE domain-containing protein [Lachnospiraceae]|uniref:FtsK/SpoIIIE domain-containing protein n=1 Tax=Lachnospiraceae TaxID=186803 RepID=UPI001314A352|nr:MULTISPECIES: FtsK/SpoIIIE domain-containing protein [Lachnospiraceae]
MSKELLTLDDLAKLKKQREEEKSKLPYNAYLDNLKTLVAEKNPKIYPSITEAKSYNNQYVCIKEPLEFIELFNGCNGQDECTNLFRKLLAEKNPRVIAQIIDKCADTNGLWFNTTQNGINLRPGLRNGEWSSPTTITLGDDAVHSLVAGRTGSGKSVFLNSIIFSLLAEYSPWELNLYLADFKKVEFSRYLSKYNVPHIKTVAATSEIRYVLSLLNYLAACMVARQNFFALIGQQKLSDVREKYQIVLPRVLLIVDEFQQLFLEATGKEEMQITDVLTSITKLGRATGFHLMFASQEMSGTMSQSVFSNFKSRFALACDAEVSNRVLGNSGAANLDKKGLVLANVGAGKGETNQLFKVPFVSEEYFYEYLQYITDLGLKSNYNSVHKFYQEDSIKGMDELNNVLDAIKNVRTEYLKKNSSLFDIITLGEAVVFNYKKYDYETVFLERGVRKNIGVFSPIVDDTVYVCKLLAENFKSSPKAESYQHFILVRNNLFMKKMDLRQELNVPDSRVYNSTGFLDEIIELFKRRSGEATLISSYSQYPSLKEFAYDAFCLRAEHFISKLSEEEKSVLQELSMYYEHKSIADIPDIQKAILEDYDFDESYFMVINLLYEKEINKKPMIDLFVPSIFWIIGAEMVGKFPKEMETVLTDAMNYNILFVLVASNNDFNDFYMCHKTCDYLFVTGNNESYYNKLRLPFTHKSENSIAVDFAISSSATQRSFKKFRYELQEVVVPEIDFDSILD